MSRYIESIVYINGRFCGVSLDVSAEPYRVNMATAEAALEASSMQQARQQIDQALSLPNEATVDLVLGYDSSHMLAYSLDIPPADKKDLAAIIDVQVEALLPLATGEMAYDWRAHAAGKAFVLATKASSVREYSEIVSEQNPVAISLNLEGVVEGWKALAAKPSEREILAWWHDGVIEVVQLDAKQVVGFRVLHADLDELTAVAEQKQLIHDLNLVISEFGADAGSVVFIPSSNAYTEKVKALQELGAPLKRAELNLKHIDSDIELEEALFVLPAIGLALGHSKGQERFELFKDVYQHHESQKRESRFPKVWVSACVAAAMFVFYLYASYLSDVNALEKMEMEPETHQEFTEMMKQQALHQEIVAQRPDLLGLFEALSPEKQKDLFLKSVDFRKGQSVKLTGLAKNDQHYNYLKTLQQSSELTDVKMNNPVYNKRKKETSFSMTFNYKQWGKKKSLYPLVKR